MRYLAVALAALLLTAVAAAAPVVTSTTQTTVMIGGLDCGSLYRLRVRKSGTGAWTNLDATTLACDPAPLPPPPPPPPPPGTCTALLFPGDSISTALAVSPVPGRVCLSSGTYVENVSYSRNPADFIELAEADGATAIVRSANASPYHTLRTQTGSSRLRVIGIKWSGVADLPVSSDSLVSGGVLDLYGSSHEILGNEVSGSGDQGIYTDDVSADFLIRGNYIHDNGLGRTHQSHGIYLQGDRHVAIENQIVNHPQGFGIQAGDRGSAQQVTWNTVDNSGYGRGCCGGMVHWGTNPGILIEHNTFSRSYGLALDRNSSASCVSVSFNSWGGDGADSFPCPMEGNIH